MSRFVPTLPQWPCDACGKRITRNQTYCCAETLGGLIGIQRTRNGAYCIACARAEAKAREATSTSGKQ